MVWALDCAPDYLSSSERFVLVALADFVGDDTGQAWPSVMRLARRTGLSRRSVQRALRTLAEVRIITDKGPAMQAARSDQRPTLYDWHPQLAMSSWHRQPSILDPDDQADPADARPATVTTYALMPIGEVLDTGRHGDAPSVDNRPDDGASPWHGASLTTGTGRHGDARTKDLIPQVEPGGTASDVSAAPRARDGELSTGPAMARAALAEAAARRKASA